MEISTRQNPRNSNSMKIKTGKEWFRIQRVKMHREAGTQPTQGPAGKEQEE